MPAVDVDGGTMNILICSLVALREGRHRKQRQGLLPPLILYPPWLPLGCISLGGIRPQPSKSSL
jgi:hypothetical protein